MRGLVIWKGKVLALGDLKQFCARSRIAFFSKIYQALFLVTEPKGCDMKLYYAKGACSLAVRILLNELNLTCQYESVDLKMKTTELGADFLAINPKGAVPTLQLDNQEILTENAVIHQYLADLHRATHLFPAMDDMKRYHILESLNYVATELHKGFGPLFHPKVPQDLKNDVFIPLMIKKFSYVDAILAKNTYFCGENYTLPDGYLYVMLRWAHSFKMDLSSMKNIERYFAALTERPSVKVSLQQEGL